MLSKRLFFLSASVIFVVLTGLFYLFSSRGKVDCAPNVPRVKCNVSQINKFVPLFLRESGKVYIYSGTKLTSIDSDKLSKVKVTVQQTSAEPNFVVSFGSKKLGYSTNHINNNLEISLLIAPNISVDEELTDLLNVLLTLALHNISNEERAQVSKFIPTKSELESTYRIINKSEKIFSL